jgi:tetratricopeptide (TPR) repeat protein
MAVMGTEIDTILNSARQARREQRLRDAKRALLEALEHCRRADAKDDLAVTLKALGQIERDMGNPEMALPVYEEAVAIYRDQDQPLALAHTIRHVADILQDMGRGELANLAYREALAIYRAHPEASALDLANAIRGLAILVSIPASAMRLNRCGRRRVSFMPQRMFKPASMKAPGGWRCWKANEGCGFARESIRAMDLISGRGRLARRV